jgi:hypothetical protein
MKELKHVLNREFLFDIGAETMNLIVPGGATGFARSGGLSLPGR